MIRAAILSCTLLLAACAVTNEPPAPEQPGVPGLELSDADRRACEAQGGTVRRAGMLGGETCIRPYADGGKACTDSAQCEGECREREGLGAPASDPQAPVAGVCQADDNPFGCYSVIENGVVAYGICVD